jgi:hypothetical protein
MTYVLCFLISHMFKGYKIFQPWHMSYVFLSHMFKVYKIFQPWHMSYVFLSHICLKAIRYFLLFHISSIFDFFIGHVSCINLCQRNPPVINMIMLTDIIILMTPQCFRVASLMRSCSCQCKPTWWRVCLLLLLLMENKNKDIVQKWGCGSFVVCCQTTSFAVHRQYTTCTCTKMNKII